MAPKPHLEIIVPIIGGFLVFFVLIVYLIWRVSGASTQRILNLNKSPVSFSAQQRFGEKPPEVLPHSGGLDGIVPTDNKRRKSGTTAHLAADIERAQKFRERARAVTAGQPKFKVSRKGRSFKTELSFHTLENHQFGDKITFRRISEDRTSSFSAYSITDIESRGGGVGGGGMDCNTPSGLVDEEMSYNSGDLRCLKITQVEEEEDSA